MNLLSPFIGTCSNSLLDPMEWRNFASIMTFHIVDLSRQVNVSGPIQPTFVDLFKEANNVLYPIRAQQQ